MLDEACKPLIKCHSFVSEASPNICPVLNSGTSEAGHMLDLIDMGPRVRQGGNKLMDHNLSDAKTKRKNAHGRQKDTAARVSTVKNSVGWIWQSPNYRQHRRSTIISAAATEKCYSPCCRLKKRLARCTCMSATCQSRNGGNRLDLASNKGWLDLPRCPRNVCIAGRAMNVTKVLAHIAVANEKREAAQAQKAKAAALVAKREAAAAALAKLVNQGMCDGRTMQRMVPSPSRDLIVPTTIGTVAVDAVTADESTDSSESNGSSPLLLFPSMELNCELQMVSDSPLPLSPQSPSVYTPSKRMSECDEDPNGDTALSDKSPVKKRRVVTCKNCGQTGHFEKTCRVQRKRISDQ